MAVARLKILQEVITLVVFVPFAVSYMREPIKLDYLWAGLCILGAVYFIFRGAWKSVAPVSTRRRLRHHFLAALLAAALSACGGGDPLVELQIEPPNLILRNQVILKGSSFIPVGSVCPATNDFIRIGVLGPHTISYTNAATGVAGTVFTDLWVCNSADGRIFYWTSNTIDLAPGPNPITVRMTTPQRSSQATITLQGSG